MTVLYSRQAAKFLDCLPPKDRHTVLHEMDLIDSGMSIEYDLVKNKNLYVKALRGPFRCKFMSIFRMRGGVRSIFYLTPDKTLVAIIQFRDADPYQDGG